MSEITIMKTPKTMHKILAVLLISFLFPIYTMASKTEVAPRFVVDGFRGGEIRLDELDGQVIYLDFWASWCGPCVKSFPFMEELQQTYGDKGLTVIAINMDQERDSAESFLDEYRVTFSIGSDPSGSLAEDFGVIGMPTAFIIDRNGVIRKTHSGFKSKDKKKITEIIEELL